MISFIDLVEKNVLKSNCERKWKDFHKEEEEKRLELREGGGECSNHECVCKYFLRLIQQNHL